ncbi:AlpA family transcriptional regulator [Acinetobacter baumannii]|nr:AlpA family transcriptional regulator [Acinetobacter baumannii]
MQISIRLNLNILISLSKTPNGLSRATIYNLLDPKSEYYDPTFPKQVRLTTNRVGWSAFEINEWIESKLAQR